MNESSEGHPLTARSPAGIAAASFKTAALSPRRGGLALGVGALGSVMGAFWGPENQVISGSVLAFGLSWAAMVDIDRMILPNLLTIGLTMIGLGLGSLSGTSQLVDRTVGAAAGYLAFMAVAFAYRATRSQDGLGRGDAKLLAAGGAWLGWVDLPYVVAVAAGSALIWALIVNRRNGWTQRFAFAPFIASGIWICWLNQ